MNSQINQNWTLLELSELLEDEDAHVCFKKTIKHFALYPCDLDNIRCSLSNILVSSQDTYDKTLKGFVLDLKNPKLVNNTGVIHCDAPFVHVDIEADFYLFQPTVGCILKGIIKKKGIDHIIILVHKIFIVSILKPYDVEEWVGDSVEVGQQIRCHLIDINEWTEPPFIRGVLKSDYLEGCKLPESTINSNVLLTIKSEELADNSSLQNNIILNSEKESTKVSTDLNIDSEINNEDQSTISNVNNSPCKEKKKIKKKHSKSRDFDLECARKIKQEKEEVNEIKKVKEEKKVQEEEKKEEKKKIKEEKEEEKKKEKQEKKVKEEKKVQQKKIKEEKEEEKKKEKQEKKVEEKKKVKEEKKVQQKKVQEEEKKEEEKKKVQERKKVKEEKKEEEKKKIKEEKKKGKVKKEKEEEKVEEVNNINNISRKRARTSDSDSEIKVKIKKEKI